MRDPDPSLRRIEVTSVAACAVMTIVALVLGGPAAAAAVVAGGLLVAVSYGSMKSGLGGIVAMLSSAAATEGVDRRRRTRRIALKMAGRYALLALLAYVMIARLRLHPLGLLAGVSSVVAAASIEAIRLQLQKSREA